MAFNSNVPMKELFSNFLPFVVKGFEEYEKDEQNSKINSNEISLFLPKVINDELGIQTTEDLKDMSSDEFVKYAKNLLERFDTDKEKNAPMGVGNFYGLQTRSTIFNDNVDSNTYEDKFGGKVLSEQEQRQHLKDIGIDVDLDEYKVEKGKNKNGEEITYFSKENYDGTKEYLKVIQNNDGEVQVIQSVTQPYQQNAITNAYNKDYLADCKLTVENNLQQNLFASVYEDVTNSDSMEERDNLYSKLKLLHSRFGLTDEEIQESISKFMSFVESAQIKNLSALQKDYNSADDKTSKEIQLKINELNSQNSIELVKYNIELVYYESQLPQEQKDVLNGLYKDLMNASDKNERDSINANIKRKQEEFNLSDKEMSLSYETQANCILASSAKQIGELYKDLAAATDQKTYDKIYAQIRSIEAESDTDMTEYLDKYFDFELNLPKYQSAELNDLFKKYKNAPSADSRIDLIKQIAQKTVDFNLNEDQRTACINKLNHYISSVYSNTLAGMYSDLADTDSDELKTEINLNLKSTYEDNNLELDEFEKAFNLGTD